MDEICEHCGKPIRIRNPSGFCDHLYCCDGCKKTYEVREVFAEAAKKELMRLVNVGNWAAVKFYEKVSGRR